MWSSWWSGEKSEGEGKKEEGEGEGEGGEKDEQKTEDNPWAKGLGSKLYIVI